jgi:hypothetical protein
MSRERRGCGRIGIALRMASSVRWVRAGVGVASAVPARYICSDIYLKVNTFMGRPPGRIQHRPLQLRVSDQFVKSVDVWRRRQSDRTSRSEAIRRLVELGLASAPTRNSKPGAREPATLAALEWADKTIETLADPSLSDEERAKIRRRLLKAPKEFREMRGDQPVPPAQRATRR